MEVWSKIADKLSIGFAAVGAFIGWFLGDINGLIYALLAFVVCDYITGIICAGIAKKLSSEIGFKGIAKKVLIFILVGLANLIDVYVIQQGAVLRSAVILFYLANEGLSILENATHLGLPLPEKFREVLLQLQKEGDKSNESE